MAQLLPYSLLTPGSLGGQLSAVPAFKNLMNVLNRGQGTLAKVVNDYITGAGVLPASGAYIGQMFWDESAVAAKWWTGSAWTAPASTSGVTQLVIGSGLATNVTDGTITTTGTITLTPIGQGELLGNATSGAAIPTGQALTTMLDAAFGAVVGGTIIRGEESWEPLTIGTAGYVLTSTGTLPAWVAAGGGSSLTLENEGTGVGVYDTTSAGTATLRSVKGEGGIFVSIGDDGTIIISDVSVFVITSGGSVVTSSGNTLTAGM
jgi:hypothetical protein